MADRQKKKTVGKKKNALTRQERRREGKESNDMTAQVMPQQMTNFKVKLPIKFAVIALSVVALSWFFEGCRQIKEGITLTHIATLIGGILFTAVLLWIQAFWIYLEEKYKGTLRRTNAHFEKVEAYWNSRKESSK